MTSPGSVQLGNVGKFGKQLVGGREAFDADPGRTRRRSDQGRRRVIHLVAAVDVEGPLYGLTRRESARVVLPRGTGVECLGILTQPSGIVLLRIDRDGHQMDARSVLAE